MKIIDTHCHLYLEEFDVDREQVLARARDAGVSKILCPAIDSRTHDRMLEICRLSDGFMIPMMGLHPTSVREDYQEELKVVERYLAENKYLAIGEVGIDLYWDTTYIKEQEDAFLTQALWAASMGVPLVIHSRNSMGHILDLLAKHSIKNLTGVFHCFSGTAEEASKAIDMGFYLGIGGPLTYKKSNLPEIIRNVRRDRVVVETDAPYLPPVHFRGKRNEPSWLNLVLQHLAVIWNISAEEASAITTQNAQRLFQLI
ncbi:MAG: TatD family hydrolase [Bacteroidales bacterium]|nr:TatD family hydrolase [Bacteroidales bacterium]